MTQDFKKYGYYIGLVLICLVIFNPSLKIPIFDADNLGALSLGIKPNPMVFFMGRLASYLPAYRPLPYLTIWLQYQILGVRPVFFFLFNQLVWITCGLILFSIISKTSSKSRVAAFLVTIIFLLDARTFASLIWIGERQSTMASLFGLLALLLVVTHTPQEGWKIRHQIGIFFLLLSSALCKEYGLSFIGVIILIMLLDKEKYYKRMIFAALAALIVYGGMRIFLAGGAVTNYCESMGFVIWEREICYSQLNTIGRIQQYAYNVFSTFFGTFFPSIFSGTGAIKTNPFSISLIWQFFVFIVSLATWIKLPKRSLPFLGLIIFNSILSFMLYRVRNQIIGLSGLYITFGIGMAYLLSLLFRNRIKHRITSPIIGIVILIFMTSQCITQAANINSRLKHQSQEFGSIDPCQSYMNFSKDININLVRDVKNLYHLSNPECEP